MCWYGHVVWVNQLNYGSNFLGQKKINKKFNKAFVLGQTAKMAQFVFFFLNGKMFWAKLEKHLG